MNMKRICFYLAITFVFAFSEVIAGDAIFTKERVVWNQTPIPITLTVGQERRVSFPAPVDAGIPAIITGTLKTQNVNNTLYWVASAPFSTSRVTITNRASGEVYLIDLKAEKNGLRNEPVEIIANAEPSKNDVRSSANGPAASSTIGFRELTRFAAQQIYAPTRLIPVDDRIWPVSLRVTDSVRLIRGRNAGRIEAIPIATWRSADFFVTAIRLRNTSDVAVTIDPREVRGEFLSATTQHARLLPEGAADGADVTALYLVSSRPFEESL